MVTRLKSMLVLLVMASTGCGVFTSSSVRITNETHAPLTTLSVDFAGVVTTVPMLAAGESVTIRKNPPRDGVIKFKFSQGNKSGTYDIMYVAPPIPVSCSLRVTPRGVYKSCSV